MKNLLYIVLFISSFQSVAQKTLDELLQQYNTRSIPYISVEELKMFQQNKDLVLLDAREPEEFKVSHIKGAVFSGYSNFSAEAISQSIKDKSVLIVVYCSLGIRSEKISEKLKAEGYSNVRNLYGGIFEWKNKGFAVFDSEGKETEKVHAYSKNWSKWLTKGEKIY
ncbi:rhodanese-like domain-containing protein [Gillisia limnaea]|uniref:Rhodanese-like protein n=1 Tax=Gillisia limnaea (strain DSM 15749 / LMG 21470 / R-8282) TaxID=865937 RepID=H2C028_GILLR|nr:rhodanese-like domain-containing protein [Gillisia limnaea]EHQ02395.1 Rhodanese-like protein [Gillisia limnaea DSM 15749]